MKRFLFVMVEAGGNVPPQLGLVRRLVARGHRVRVLTDRVLQPAVEQAGAEYAPFVRARHHHTSSRTEDVVRDWEVKQPLQKIKRFGEHIMFAPAENYARDVLAEVERHPPDALGVDCVLFGAMIGAERSGLPTACLMHTVCQLPLPGVPPFGLGLPRAAGPLGRLRDRALWRLCDRIFDGFGLAPLNATRATLGLEPVAHVTAVNARAHRVLIMTSAAFDFVPESLPDNVRYTGAPVDDPSWAGDFRSPFDDARNPLVLLALGSTFQNQGPTLQRAIDALGALQVRGLVTLGKVFEPSEFRCPDNVRVLASAPHSVLLPQARLTIAHGGHGTVIKSLAAAVPLLCIPFGRDQMDNAARVVHAGAGLKLSPGASVSQLRATIAHLLAEPRFTDAARRMARAIGAEREHDVAVHELEALAARAPLPAPS